MSNYTYTRLLFWTRFQPGKDCKAYTRLLTYSHTKERGISEMKNVLVDLLKENGFTEQPMKASLECEALLLAREWSEEVEVVWHGKLTRTYKVEVFVNLSSGVCHVTYWNGCRSPYKDRWYDTTGKRTFNAIVETTRCAGFEF